jgi:WD40 repeat protein
MNGGSTTLHYWDLATGRDRIAQADAHSQVVDNMLVTPDGKTLITSSHESSVRLWDLASGRKLRALEHRGEVHTIALSGDGRTLLAGAGLPSLFYLWDLKAEIEPVICGGGFSSLLTTSNPIAIFLSRPDDALLSVDTNGRLRSWGITEQRTKEVTEPVWSPADFPIKMAELMEQALFFAGGRRLAIRGALGGLHVADLDTGKERYVVSDAKLVALSSDEQTLAVWKPGDHSANKLFWDGQVIGNNLDGSILLLASATGNQKIQIAVPGPEVWAMAFSPDGKALAATTGWEEGRIHLYEVATGKETRTITTPPLRKSVIAFTPDGSRIVSGMADTSVLVWDLREGHRSDHPLS